MRAKDTFSQAQLRLQVVGCRCRIKRASRSPFFQRCTTPCRPGDNRPLAASGWMTTRPVATTRALEEFCLYTPASLQFWREDRSSQLIRRAYNSKGFYGVIQMATYLAQRGIVIATPELRARLDQLKKSAGKLRAPAPRFIPRTDDNEAWLNQLQHSEPLRGRELREPSGWGRDQDGASLCLAPAQGVGEPLPPQRSRPLDVHARGAEVPPPAKPRQLSNSFNQAIILPVPCLCQRDSATGQGLRMCCSSTCAMAATYLKPGCLTGAGQPDDRYLTLLQRHGDTTDAVAQIQTLRSLGIRAELRTDGCLEQLIAQLKLGYPVPVGWLHHGPISAPSGGGHVSLVIGLDPASRSVLMHDPNGEADLMGGG